MIIQSKRTWIHEQWVAAQLEIDDRKIIRILTYNSKNADIDYGNNRIYPGFIDTHCHGAFGFDTNSADEDGLRYWLTRAPEEGVTLLCPTTITQSEDVLIHALKNVAKVMRSTMNGAQIAGVHFEGPYLSAKFKGAQPEEFIELPDLQQFKRYEEAAEGNIKIITLAVENDEDYQFVRYADSKRISVHIGHSAATYQEALFALANGVSGFTHTFNGMSPFNHREPGLVGAAMQVGDCFSELICDGVHVSWSAVNLLFRSKGKDYVVLVTDALQAKGIGEGSYIFGGQAIDIRSDGGAYLANTKGLAGSTLMFNEGIRNVISLAGVDETSAINAATVNPAKVLNLNHSKGKIQSNYDADLVILDDQYDVIETFVLGKSVYRK
jgi:N-acetylglucosamine-6-phosphate deacetylase